MKNKIISFFLVVGGAVFGGGIVGKITKDIILERTKKTDKFKDYYAVLNQWLILKQENKNLSSYFEKNGYKTIAIYGMGEMGNRLYDELKKSNITVEFAIDNDPAHTYTELLVIDVNEIDKKEKCKVVDAVVVTAVFAFEEVSDRISKIFNCPIVSLEDVVYQI